LGAFSHKTAEAIRRFFVELYLQQQKTAELLSAVSVETRLAVELLTG